MSPVWDVCGGTTKTQEKALLLIPLQSIQLGLSFQGERQGTNFVTTFDKEHCTLSAPSHTKLQMLVCRIHHYPPFPYQQGIFGFLLYFYS